jgi:hypothetical protein
VTKAAGKHRRCNALLTRRRLPLSLAVMTSRFAFAAISSSAVGGWWRWSLHIAKGAPA